MRIISGQCGGRTIHLPANLQLRPTTDFAKTALFNIISNNFDIDEIKVLDLFSGSGCISYEFASRGAISVLSIDKNKKCIEFIKKTAAEFKLATIKTLTADVFSFIKQPSCSYSIVFADPPYAMVDEIKALPELVFSANLIKEDGWFIIEHGKDVDHSLTPRFFRHVEYGHVHFSFFK